MAFNPNFIPGGPNIPRHPYYQKGNNVKIPRVWESRTEFLGEGNDVDTVTTSNAPFDLIPQGGTDPTQEGYDAAGTAFPGSALNPPTWLGEAIASIVSTETTFEVMFEGGAKPYDLDNIYLSAGPYIDLPLVWSTDRYTLADAGEASTIHAAFVTGQGNTTPLFIGIADGDIAPGQPLTFFFNGQRRVGNEASFTLFGGTPPYLFNPGDGQSSIEVLAHQPGIFYAYAVNGGYTAIVADSATPPSTRSQFVFLDWIGLMGTPEVPEEPCDV